MDHKTLIRHLTDYSRTMLRDLGDEQGRRVLRGNIPHWRTVYGDAVADQMSQEIRAMLSEKPAPR